MFDNPYDISWYVLLIRISRYCPSSMTLARSQFYLQILLTAPVSGIAIYPLFHSLLLYLCIDFTATLLVYRNNADYTSSTFRSIIRWRCAKGVLQPPFQFYRSILSLIRHGFPVIINYVISSDYSNPLSSQYPTGNSKEYATTF